MTNGLQQKHIAFSETHQRSVANVGRVWSLHIAPERSAEMQTVERAYAVSGRGLEGDRYFHRRGTWSPHPGSGRQITLIEMETLLALERDYGIVLAPARARRNIVTSGVCLNDLLGNGFRVGKVRLRGTRLCDPCAHLERLSVHGTLRALVDRGGLRADVLSDGFICVGDVIALVAGASI
jgi:MOSC domain-containing protein YiiM